MANLSNSDKQKLESLLDMGGGYILDFNNRTFNDFFATIGIDIYQAKYEVYGRSKANHLRVFWDKEPDTIVARVLQEMLERWRTNKLLGSSDITTREQMLYDECAAIVNRLNGRGQPESEQEFLARELGKISLQNLDIDEALRNAIEQRVSEIDKCIKALAPLAAIFLCGSTLEGLLLNCASKNPQKFNVAKSAPKDKKTYKTLPLPMWSLAQLIDVAKEQGFIQEDVRKFSDNVRDFRNYIHPHQQAMSQFNPSAQTAELCFKVLQLAILQLSESA